MLLKIDASALLSMTDKNEDTYFQTKGTIN